MKTTYKGLTAIGAATAGAAAANIVIGQRAGTPASMIGGSERTYAWPLGDIFYAKAGEGDPLLFVHGVGAGASSFEWRRNFLPLSEGFETFALDLLGFGLSDKPDTNYNPIMYAELITDFILDVIGRPTTVAASSHSAAYAIMAADRNRLIINRVILSCPTGIGYADTKESLSPGLNIALRVPVFGKSVYYGLTSRKGIEEYLKAQIYADPASVTEEVIEQYYRSSHQPGAEKAIRAFVSGGLNVNVRDQFASLTQPAALVWGRQAKIVPVEISEQFLQANPQARLEILDHAAQLPHEERPDAWNAVARDILTRPPEGATAPPHEHTV